MTNRNVYNQPLNQDPNYNQYNQQYGVPPNAQYGAYPQQPTYPQFQDNPYQQYPPQQPQYPPQQSYQPPTAQQAPYQPQYKPQQQPSYQNQNTNIPSSYDYDPYNIQYQRIQVENWQQIPPDPSPYSQMWANPQAFEPQSFANNTKADRKYNDLCWLIFFWINFVVSIAVIIWLGIAFKNKFEEDQSGQNFLRKLVSSNDDIENYDTTKLWGAVGIGAAIGAVLNIIHYCYATFAPVVYIKAGIWIGLIISVICVIIPVIKGVYMALILPGITLLFSLIMYCCMRKYIKLSAAVMAVTTKIICRYPSIILLVVLQSIWEVIISIAFSLAFFFVEYTQMVRYIYIYLLLSYFWITITFGYVTYMTGSGLAASWYFLNDTEFFPKSPVWESFKRASTTSFGSASLAGFLLAVIKTLQVILESDNNSGGDNGAAKLVICLLKCIALCVLKILEACISFINRYALIYCAVFGVPFKEGCRRWTELSCHRFCNVLLSGCCISTALSYNGFIFVLSAGAIGYISGALVFHSLDLNGITIFYMVFAIVFTFAIFAVFCQPIMTVSDTLLICFSEAPEKLKTSAAELYENLKTYYHESVDEKIAKLNN